MPVDEKLVDKMSSKSARVDKMLVLSNHKNASTLINIYIKIIKNLIP